MKIIESAVKTIPPSLMLVAALCGTSCVPGVCAPDYKNIIGDWTSNYGPVHVKFIAAEKPEGSASVVGTWQEGPKKEGKIEAGHYNAGTGELDADYIETWTKHRGKVKLVMDKNGKGMTGTFKGDDGTTGTWTWSRK